MQFADFFTTQQNFRPVQTESICMAQKKRASKAEGKEMKKTFCVKEKMVKMLVASIFSPFGVLDGSMVKC